MLDSRTFAASKGYANPAGLFYASARHPVANATAAIFLRISVIVLVVTLAILVHAADGSAAGGNQARASNSTVQIPSNAQDSAVSADSDDYTSDAEGEGAVIVPGQGIPDADGARFADIDQFATNDDVYESPIGALLQHDCAELAPRQDVCGLAVLEVRPGSVAAAAGMRLYRGLVHTLLGATVVSAAMVFPPAIAALGLVEQSHVGESFDLIIGVDGQRIHTIHDFQGALAEVHVGDVIYVTVVRNGKRLQMPLRITG